MPPEKGGFFYNSACNVLMESEDKQNSIDEEELEEWQEELETRLRTRRKERGREANRKDRKIFDSVAREKGMSKTQRQQFGDYIE